MFIFILYTNINNKSNTIQNNSKTVIKISSKMCACGRVNNASLFALEENHFNLSHVLFLFK